MIYKQNTWPLFHHNEKKYKEKIRKEWKSLIHHHIDEQVYKRRGLNNRWAPFSWTAQRHLLITTRHWERMTAWTLTRYKHTLHILYFTSGCFFLFFFSLSKKWKSRDRIIIHNLATIYSASLISMSKTNTKVFFFSFFFYHKPKS